MSVAVNLLSAVLKSVAGDQLGTGLTKELIGISIDEISEKGMDRAADFIRRERTKINHILSKDHMESMGVSRDKIDYVVAEIKDLFSKVNISDEVLRHCKYDGRDLSVFLWSEYCNNKEEDIECEGEIKKSLFSVAIVLLQLVRESEAFEKNILIHISNSVDDTYNEMRKVSEYMQKSNMQDNEVKNITNEYRKFKNNKKEDYIKNWNSRLFLDVDNENSLTLSDAFIMPDYRVYKYNRRINFSYGDTLIKMIEKFIMYDKTSTMLITGAPGMGKSSITSWIANEYKDDDRIIILRFRDWTRVILEKKLLSAICHRLDCENEDLEDKVLILDGYDEMKALDIREKLLTNFMNEIKDFNNFKCIITSRPTYINSIYFENHFELKVFDIRRIDDFYKIVAGKRLEEREKIESNLDVLGIPVILYMAIRSKVDISQNPTKPELYGRIFSKESGIFDKFCCDGVGYDIGQHILRNSENIKKYLEFLGEVAFIMFEKDDLSLAISECQIPELTFQEKTISILEFPIRHLFESTIVEIEFIHKSIYEYFVSEYIFMSVEKVMNISKEKVAEVLGRTLKRKRIPDEILDFLRFRISNSELNNNFCIVNEAFEIMLKDGMTYYTNECYKNVIQCEANIFANMLDILHIWEKFCFKFNDSVSCYLRVANENLDLRGADLSNIDLSRANLKGAFLQKTNFKDASLKGADLSKADFFGANLVGVNLSGVDVTDSGLKDAIF